MMGPQRKFIPQQKSGIKNCLKLCSTIQQNKNICKWPFVYLSNIMNWRIFLALEIKWVTSAICKTLNFTYIIVQLNEIIFEGPFLCLHKYTLARGISLIISTYLLSCSWAPVTNSQNTNFEIHEFNHWLHELWTETTNFVKKTYLS